MKVKGGDFIKKIRSRAFGKDCYLLGADKKGVWYWLEAAKWDCDWYWGLGYVESYTRNESPITSKDVSSHNHFDSMFLGKAASCKDMFDEFFVETPLNDNEVWKLLELMNAAYIARRYSDMLYSGGAHISENPMKETIRNEVEYKRINEEVIPALMAEVYKLLSEENSDE